MKLESIMTTDLFTVDPETTLQEAVSLLVAEHIGGVPVVAGGRLVGVMSATDILEFEASPPGRPGDHATSSGYESVGRVAGWDGEDPTPASFFADAWEDTGTDVAERIGATDASERNLLAEYTVSDVMTRTVFSLPPDIEVQDAAGRMLEADVHRVLVMEDDELLGLVSTRDVLRAVAEHGLEG